MWKTASGSERGKIVIQVALEKAVTQIKQPRKSDKADYNEQCDQ